MNKSEQLQKIADDIRACAFCKEGGSGKAVPGEGNPDAEIIFIGEAPGRQEALTGRPFVGRSGKFVRQTLRDLGLRESDVFITSPVHYLPLKGIPSKAMILHGSTHLFKQIEIIKPRLLVLLGNTACRALLGKGVEIGKQHGTVIHQSGMAIFLSFHPAYVMRFPEGRKKFFQDLTILKKLIDNPPGTASLLKK